MKTLFTTLRVSLPSIMYPSSSSGRQPSALIRLLVKVIEPAIGGAIDGEGMSFVNGAPWNTQDAVAERTEAVAP